MLFIYLQITDTNSSKFDTSFSVIIITFIQIFTPLIYFLYFYSISTNIFTKIHKILQITAELKKDITYLTYPCTYCEQTKSITLVLALRDTKIVNIPTNLLVYDDIILLTEKQINLNSIHLEDIKILTDNETIGHIPSVVVGSHCPQQPEFSEFIMCF
ncbi:hypothetical protein HZS_2965 [Henneguya salminicola]|nr:hypothetical protein HZS_2965 [Henneguya salminicola]